MITIHCLLQELGVVVRCPDCKELFCYDCDLYIHETLHNCPGCEAMSVEKQNRGEQSDHDALAMNEG